MKPMTMSSPTKPYTSSFLLLLIFLSTLITTANSQQFNNDNNNDQTISSDYYCGRTWNEANQKCAIPCPSGNDSDCPPVESTGRARRCFASAGCLSRTEKLYWTGVVSLEFDRVGHLENTVGKEGGGTTTQATQTVSGATTTFSTGDTGESATQEQNAMMTEAPLMNKEQSNIFQSTFAYFLNEAIKEKMEITSVYVDSQSYDWEVVGAVTGRGDDPSMTALDMTVSVSSQYIPVGDLEFTDGTFGDSIMVALEQETQVLLNELRDKSPFFQAATGVSTALVEDLPEEPSHSPSASPTRGNYQILETYIDSRPTGSYGILFSVKTLPGVDTILVHSLSFVTRFEGMLEYEVYTKLGGYSGHHGRFKSFDFIASGRVLGQGPQAFTRINDMDDVYQDVNVTKSYLGFRSVHIPGNRGERSFYITIKKVAAGEDQPPILFSYPINEQNDGKYIYDVITSSQEIEIYEGDGVLDEPFPKDSESPYYRRPRGFLGVVEYDKAPCFPSVNVTTWPCPYVKETRNPTRRPARKPTGKPTNVEVSSAAPVAFSNSVAVESDEVKKEDGAISMDESEKEAGGSTGGGGGGGGKNDVDSDPGKSSSGERESPDGSLVDRVEEPSSASTEVWRSPRILIHAVFVLIVFNVNIQ